MGKKEKIVMMRLKDLLEMFKDMDREWLQVDEKQSLVFQSREGWNYSPNWVGKIVVMEHDIPGKNDVKPSENIVHANDYLHER